MGRLLREVEIGMWYDSLDTSDRFEVVAMDESNHTIEIQYFDGTVEDIDYESWSQMNVRDCAPPDDDSGALDTETADYDVGALLLNATDDTRFDVEQIGLNDTLY